MLAAVVFICDETAFINNIFLKMFVNSLKAFGRCESLLDLPNEKGYSKFL
jgi:hypothetical protein